MLKVTINQTNDVADLTMTFTAQDMDDAVKGVVQSVDRHYHFAFTNELANQLRADGSLTVQREGGDLVIEVTEVMEFQPDPRNPIYLYVLCRTDMESLVGTPDKRKAGLPCAQTGHAANQMVYQARKKNIESLNNLLTEWENETGMGFGTEIVKGAHYADIKQTVDLAVMLGHHASMVKDPEYPLWDGKTLHLIPVETCAYIFGRKNELDPILRRFDLLA